MGEHYKNELSCNYSVIKRHNNEPVGLANSSKFMGMEVKSISCELREAYRIGYRHTELTGDQVLIKRGMKMIAWFKLIYHPGQSSNAKARTSGVGLRINPADASPLEDAEIRRLSMKYKAIPF